VSSTSGVRYKPPVARHPAWVAGRPLFEDTGCPPDVPQLEDIEFIPCAGRLADRRVPFAAAQ